jgi:hypothetical protein
MDQNVYVLYTGGQKFSYFTTVIFKKFEADYQPLDLKKTLRSCWFIIFDFQQLLFLAKIDPTSGYGDKKCQKS